MPDGRIYVTLKRLYLGEAKCVMQEMETTKNNKCVDWALVYLWD